MAKAGSSATHVESCTGMSLFAFDVVIRRSRLPAVLTGRDMHAVIKLGQLAEFGCTVIYTIDKITGNKYTRTLLNLRSFATIVGSPASWSCAGPTDIRRIS